MARHIILAAAVELPHAPRSTRIGVEDYYQVGRRSWLRLREKGGKFYDAPAHHNAKSHLEAYLGATRVGLLGRVVRYAEQADPFATVDRTLAERAHAERPLAEPDRR